MKKTKQKQAKLPDGETNPSYIESDSGNKEMRFSDRTEYVAPMPAAQTLPNILGK